MILGMSLSTFTTFHVILSLVGIVSGLVVLFGMFGSKKMPGCTAIFLLTTVLTSATGFLFPRGPLLPSHFVGIVSLVILAVAIIALYLGKLVGSWRWVYVVTAVIALYLNVFVLVAQLFAKFEPLRKLAPTQSEPPFAIAQGIVLLIYIWLCVKAVRQFHPAPPR